jgi:serine/threonine-protein kinase
MDSSDAMLLRLLTARAGLSGEQSAVLQAWWLADREDGEALTGFLARQGVLSQQAAAGLGQFRRGYVSPDLFVALLSADDLERLGRRLELLRRPTPDAADTLAALAPSPLSSGGGSPSLDGPRVGQRLGKYLLTQVLGEGATGRVFRALHPALDLSVAIKALRLPRTEQAAGLFRQLRAEARLLARLDHPHIVRLLDFEEAGPFPFCVLEYVEGVNLHELVSQSGRLRPDRAVMIVRQVASALAAASEFGVIHRDVKPANVLLTRRGHAKLTDFGLAAVTGEQLAAVAGALPAGLLVGTAGFMAPEAATAPGAVDHRSDIFSLGVTLYHAVTGRLPFLEGTAVDALAARPGACAVPPEEHVPDLDPALGRLLLDMLATDPANRLGDYPTLLRRLTRLELTLSPPVEDD